MFVDKSEREQACPVDQALYNDGGSANSDDDVSKQFSEHQTPEMTDRIRLAEADKPALELPASFLSRMTVHDNDDDWSPAMLPELTSEVNSAPLTRGSWPIIHTRMHARAHVHPLVCSCAGLEEFCSGQA